MIRVADSQEVPVRGWECWILKDCLWVPMARKNVLTESQLTTESQINREPDPPEAIVYRGTSGSTKSFFELTSRISLIVHTKSINLTSGIFKLVVQLYLIEMKRFLLMYPHKKRLYNALPLKTVGVLLGDDEIALNDTDQARHSLALARDGKSYLISAFQLPSPVSCVCSECDRKFYYSSPSAMAEVCVAHVSKSKALKILHQSVDHITPERLQHLVASDPWS